MKYPILSFECNNPMHIIEHSWVVKNKQHYRVSTRAPIHPLAILLTVVLRAPSLFSYCRRQIHETCHIVIHDPWHTIGGRTQPGTFGLALSQRPNGPNRRRVSSVVQICKFYTSGLMQRVKIVNAVAHWSTIMVMAFEVSECCFCKCIR